MTLLFDNQPRTLSPVTESTRRKLAVAVEDTEAANELIGALDSSLKSTVREISSSQTVSASDSVLLCDAASGPLTLTLLSPQGNSGVFIKKVDSTGNTVTVAGGESLIDGSPTAVLTVQYEAITLVSAASAWWIL